MGGFVGIRIRRTVPREDVGMDDDFGEGNDFDSY
jgi:hypothetical protein